MKTFNPFEIYHNSDRIKDSTLRHFDRTQKEGTFLVDEGQTQSLRKMDFPSSFSWVLFAWSALFGIFFTRLGYLQIAQGNFYRESAEINRIRVQNTLSPRGIFMDRKGTLLVKNVPNFILSIVPGDLPRSGSDRESVLNRVAERANVSREDILRKISGVSSYSFQPVSITDQIPYTSALLLQSEISTMPGVELSVSATRERLQGPELSNILGYTGIISPEEYAQMKKNGYVLTDRVGKTGIELAFEEIVRGTAGKRQIEVDSQGKEKKIIATTNPIPGNTIRLTIDAELQRILYEAVMRKLDETGSSGGAAVALDPSSGDILAIVSAPSYNTNLFEKGISQEEYNALLADPRRPLFNRAISGEYPSGSTIKPVIAAAALQEGIITPRTTVDSVGGFSIGQQFFPDWKAGGHGLTDVRKAIAESVNTFFYTIGGGRGTLQGLGVTRIVEYAQKFGFGSLLGIQLPGERPGLLPTQEWREKRGEPWRLGDTYHLSIGQGDILVTPLQMAMSTAAIANGGTLYRPELIDAILNPAGETVNDGRAEVIRDAFIDSSHLETVREGMRQGVLSGSSRALQDLPFSSAGKTGTAQFGTENKTHAWFIGFAPYDNPKIVICVLIEGGGEGHATALPVAKEGFQYFLTPAKNSEENP